jgi:superfamily II DNA or RNA helicase
LECIAKCRLGGAIKALVVMATRLGKTIMAALDVKRFLEDPKARLLFLCHKTDILYQARSEFEVVLGHEKTYGFFHGKDKSFHKVDCLFSSFETMSNYIEMFRPDEFDYVIVDESHHSHAETYLPIINYFHPKFLLGLTATPNRMDQKDITEIYGKPVYELPLEKALALGYFDPA